MARDWKQARRPLGLALAMAVLAGCHPSGDVPSLAESAEDQKDAAPPSHRADSGGETHWVHPVRSAGDADAPVAVAHDTRDNVITLGNHRTPIDLGQGPQGSPAGASALVLSKYAPDGRLLWVRLFTVPAPALTGPLAGGLAEVTPYVRGQALAVEKQGTLLLVGVQSGGLELAGTVLPPGSFLARLDADGRPLWARPLPTSATELAIDNRGHIGLAGVLTGTVDFGNGPVQGNGNPYLVQLDATGALRWLYVDPARGVPMDLAQDDSGDLYLSGGRFPPASPLLTPFVMRVSAEGQRQWTRQLEGASGLVTSVAAHGDHVVVAGYATGQFVFRGELLQAPTSRGFALAYDQDGNERWGFLLGSIGGLVAMDQGSGVVVAGRYRGKEEFGLGLGKPDGYPGATNLYVLRLQRPTGKLQWAHTYRSASALPVDLSVARQGESVLTGTFRAPVYFDTGTLDPTPGGNTFLLQLER